MITIQDFQDLKASLSIERCRADEAHARRKGVLMEIKRHLGLVRRAAELGRTAVIIERADTLLEMVERDLNKPTD